MSRFSSSNQSGFDRRWWWIIAAWFTIPVLFFGIWYGFFLNLLFDGTTTTQDVRRWLFENIWHGTFKWWYLAVMFIVTIGFWLWIEDSSADSTSKLTSRITGIASTIGLVLSIVCIFHNNFTDDKREAQYYAGSTVFYTPSLENVPASLSRLIEGSSGGDGENCDRVGPADVSSCIKLGDLQDGWDARTGSFKGAKVAITRTSAASAGVSLLEDTVTYLNGAGEQSAGWSGILDGSGKRQPLAGVAEWSGSGQVNQCYFRGDYAINRAFSGEWTNNLPNLIAETYPMLHYNMTDVWGYCDASEPVIVIPMTSGLAYASRTVTQAAGIVTIRGDHGNVKFDHLTDIEPGALPGPVYPMSLVAKQREMLNWAAGRGFKKQNSFGFEPSSSAVQAGNTSEYLLRETATGRLMYVTPLTLSGSTSEIFVAYGLTYADEVHAGRLNQYGLYALPDGDPRMLNIDELDAKARGDVSRSARYGTFLNTGGSLLEYTPINGTLWRAYGERNGRVELYMDASPKSSIKPVIVLLDDSAGDLATTPQTDVATSNEPNSDTDETAAAACGKNPVDMTDEELDACLAAIAAEYGHR